MVDPHSSSSPEPFDFHVISHSIKSVSIQLTNIGNKSISRAKKISEIETIIKAVDSYFKEGFQQSLESGFRRADYAHRLQEIQITLKQIKTDTEKLFKPNAFLSWMAQVPLIGQAFRSLTKMPENLSSLNEDITTVQNIQRLHQMVEKTTAEPSHIQHPQFVQLFKTDTDLVTENDMTPGNTAYFVSFKDNQFHLNTLVLSSDDKLQFAAQPITIASNGNITVENSSYKDFESLTKGLNLGKEYKKSVEYYLDSLIVNSKPEISNKEAQEKLKGFETIYPEEFNSSCPYFIEKGDDNQLTLYKHDPHETDNSITSHPLILKEDGTLQVTRTGLLLKNLTELETQFNLGKTLQEIDLTYRTEQFKRFQDMTGFDSTIESKKEADQSILFCTSDESLKPIYENKGSVYTMWEKEPYGVGTNLAYIKKGESEVSHAIINYSSKPGKLLLSHDNKVDEYEKLQEVFHALGLKESHNSNQLFKKSTLYQAAHEMLTPYIMDDTYNMNIKKNPGMSEKLEAFFTEKKNQNTVCFNLQADPKELGTYVLQQYKYTPGFVGYISKSRVTAEEPITFKVKENGRIKLLTQPKTGFFTSAKNTSVSHFDDIDKLSEFLAKNQSITSLYEEERLRNFTNNGIVNALSPAGVKPGTYKNTEVQLNLLKKNLGEGSIGAYALCVEKETLQFAYIDDTLNVQFIPIKGSADKPTLIINGKVYKLPTDIVESTTYKHHVYYQGKMAERSQAFLHVMKSPFYYLSKQASIDDSADFSKDSSDSPQHSPATTPTKNTDNQLLLGTSQSKKIRSEIENTPSLTNLKNAVEYLGGNAIGYITIYPVTTESGIEEMQIAYVDTDQTVKTIPIDTTTQAGKLILNNKEISFEEGNLEKAIATEIGSFEINELKQPQEWLENLARCQTAYQTLISQEKGIYSNENALNSECSKLLPALQGMQGNGYALYYPEPPKKDTPPEKTTLLLKQLQPDGEMVKYTLDFSENPGFIAVYKEGQEFPLENLRSFEDVKKKLHLKSDISELRRLSSTTQKMVLDVQKSPSYDCWTFSKKDATQKLETVKDEFGTNAHGTWLIRRKKEDSNPGVLSMMSNYWSTLRHDYFEYGVNVLGSWFGLSIGNPSNDFIISTIQKNPEGDWEVEEHSITLDPKTKKFKCEDSSYDNMHALVHGKEVNAKGKSWEEIHHIRNAAKILQNASMTEKELPHPGREKGAINQLRACYQNNKQPCYLIYSDSARQGEFKISWINNAQKVQTADIHLFEKPGSYVLHLGQKASIQNNLNDIINNKGTNAKNLPTLLLTGSTLPSTQNTFKINDDAIHLWNLKGEALSRERIADALTKYKHAFEGSLESLSCDRNQAGVILTKIIGNNKTMPTTKIQAMKLLRDALKNGREINVSEQDKEIDLFVTALINKAYEKE